MSGNSILQHILAPLGTHGVADTTANNLAAENIYYGCHIHKASSHRDVGNICTPNLVGTGDIQVIQQVGLDKDF